MVNSDAGSILFLRIISSRGKQHYYVHTACKTSQQKCSHLRPLLSFNILAHHIIKKNHPPPENEFNEGTSSSFIFLFFAKKKGAFKN